MAVYRFSPFLGTAESDQRPNISDLPPFVNVMHAGELVCRAELEHDAYVCELPEEYSAKLSSGKLEQVFVYEPPFLDTDVDKNIRRELVSILLVGATRKSPDPT